MVNLLNEKRRNKGQILLVSDYLVAWHQKLLVVFIYFLNFLLYFSITI